MTLGAAITAAMPQLRLQAESMMTDACTITRPGAPVFDPATGTYTTPSTPIYTGKCRVRTRSVGFLRDRTAEAGDTQTVIWPYIVSIPLSVTDIHVLDVVTVTASADPALVDVQMRVRVASLGTSTNARRMDCEQIASD